jgi:hypothetical protein
MSLDCKVWAVAASKGRNTAISICFVVLNAMGTRKVLPLSIKFGV